MLEVSQRRWECRKGDKEYESGSKKKVSYCFFSLSMFVSHSLYNNYCSIFIFPSSRSFSLFQCCTFETFHVVLPLALEVCISNQGLIGILVCGLFFMHVVVFVHVLSRESSGCFEVTCGCLGSLFERSIWDAFFTLH